MEPSSSNRAVAARTRWNVRYMAKALLALVQFRDDLTVIASGEQAQGGSGERGPQRRHPAVAESELNYTWMGTAELTGGAVKRAERQGKIGARFPTAGRPGQRYIDAKVVHV